MPKLYTAATPIVFAQVLIGNKNPFDVDLDIMGDGIGAHKQWVTLTDNDDDLISSYTVEVPDAHYSNIVGEHVILVRHVVSNDHTWAIGNEVAMRLLFAS